MKYNNEVIINKPIDVVTSRFDDPENLAKWQPGFISMEHLDGVPGEPGATSRIKYKMGKREIEMIETILVRNLPHEFSGTYEAKGVWNKVINHFEPIDEHSTRYWTENEFRFKGFMKIVATLMPGAFKKQSQKYLDLFKEFVEGDAKVSS